MKWGGRVFVVRCVDVARLDLREEKKQETRESSSVHHVNEKPMSEREMYKPKSQRNKLNGRTYIV